MSKKDSSSGTRFAESDAINVLIAYDDLIAAQRAMQLFSRVGEAYAGDFFCQPQPWRFDLLADPDWGRCAAADALRADLIVVTTNKHSELPIKVQSWLSGCLLRNRGFHGAIVALLGINGDSDVADSSSLRFLQSVAREAGMDFFVPVSRPSYEELSVEPALQHSGRTASVLPDLSRLSPPKTIPISPPRPPQLFSRGYPYRGWGINE